MMKKLYSIEIKEVLKDTVEVEAENSAEAEYLAEKGYYDGKYVLDSVEAENSKLSFVDTNSPQYISDNRKTEIFHELIDYISEHTIDEKDFYASLKDVIGLTDSEITELGIDVKRELTATTPLQECEIVFEDEIFMDGNVNAYIPLYYINIFDKFEIEEKEGIEYNLYLDYEPETEKCTLNIIEKNDKGYVEYQYETSKEENRMLKEKLNEYFIERYNQTLEEAVEEVTEISR
jgi:hypothetical protein